MDEVDKLILDMLQEDGRTPFTEIAKRAGVSETTIRTRYRHLTQEGIIRTVGIADPYALGFNAPALVHIRVAPGQIDPIASQLIQLPELSYLVMTLGSSDLVAEVFCRDLPQLAEFITTHIHGIEGVLSTETLMIAKSYKLSYRWSPIPESESESSDAD